VDYFSSTQLRQLDVSDWIRFLKTALHYCQHDLQVAHSIAANEDLTTEY